MPNVILNGTLKGYKTLADGGCDVTISCQELTPDQGSRLVQLHKQQHPREPFESFYNRKMENLINQIKERLE